MSKLLTIRNLALAPTSLVLGLLLLLVPGMRQSAEQQDHGLPGAWLETITATDNSFQPFQVLSTYNSDGGLVATASIDMIPASLSSPTHGAWVRTGQRTFRDSNRAFSYDAQANPNGMYFISENFTLDKTGDAWSGSCAFSIVNNGQVLFSGTCTTVATRIKP